MELTFAQQSIAFLRSIVLGVALGMVYGIFRFIRIAFGFKKIATIISDILYMLIVFVSVFLFSLAYLLGYIRVYVFIGTGLGVLIYIITLGRVMSKIYTPFIVCIKKIIKKINCKIKKNTKKLLKNIYNILYNNSNKRRIFGSEPKKSDSVKKVMSSDEEKTAAGRQSSVGFKSAK